MKQINKFTTNNSGVKINPIFLVIEKILLPLRPFLYSMNKKR